MAITPFYLLFLIRTGLYRKRVLITLFFFVGIGISQPQCTFDRAILGEYYSYENGLETHTSFEPTGILARRFYRRQSGLGASANIITILDNQAMGECFQLNWRENPAQHISKQHFELISRDKSVLFLEIFLD